MKKTLLLTALLATAGFAQAESVTYNIDPSHTFVTFEVPHFATSTARGRFDKKQGSITIDRAEKTGKAEITIDTTSLSTGIAPFDGHLKSKDFLNVAEFPTAQFVADKFTFDGDKVASVAGTLTLVGKTQPVKLVATNFNCYQSPILKREVCGGDFGTSFQRSTFGITYGLPGIPDNVRLVIQIEAAKQ
jgi:polyisoprenoid-binding protein YceI